MNRPFLLKLKGFITVILLISVSAAASTDILVVSDIDDTLKVSHILSKRGSFSSIFDDDSRFVGMAELFQALGQQNSSIEFHYVSLAPRFLMEGRHQEFLEENGFPATELHMNPGIKQDPELKQKVIRNLIETRQPSLVLLFGDNGQFDVPVYELMQSEFQNTPMQIFIREAYSSQGKSPHPTRPGQIGFVTSVEVALTLMDMGLVEWQDYQLIENQVYRQLLKENGRETFGEMVFPWWQDCRDFVWKWTSAPINPQLDYIQSRILQRCAN